MFANRTAALRTAVATGVVAVALAACGTAGTASPSASASAPASPSDVASPSASASPSAGSPSAPAGDAVTITGTEYRYDGVPATVTVGTTLAFTNAGQEAHEMVTIRRNDDVTQSFTDLLAMPQEEALGLVSILGAPVANPGETAEATITITEPGTYALVCFIPVGLTEIPESLDPNASLPTGAPHFTQGMVAEFTVGG